MLLFHGTVLFSSIDLKMGKKILGKPQKHQPDNPLETLNLRMYIYPYFKFNGDIYEQIKGMSTGSPENCAILKVQPKKIESDILMTPFYCLVFRYRQ